MAAAHRPTHPLPSKTSTAVPAAHRPTHPIFAKKNPKPSRPTAAELAVPSAMIPVPTCVLKTCPPHSASRKPSATLRTSRWSSSSPAASSSPEAASSARNTSRHSARFDSARARTAAAVIIGQHLQQQHLNINRWAARTHGWLQ
eukprot:1157902-Pelagomonas_calceolata.AAC.7